MAQNDRKRVRRARRVVGPQTFFREIEGPKAFKKGRRVFPSTPHRFRDISEKLILGPQNGRKLLSPHGQNGGGQNFFLPKTLFWVF